MNYKDISAVVQQPIVPVSVQEDILTKAKRLINEGYEVEVVVSTNTVTLDVYDEFGTRIDIIKKTFSKARFIVPDEDEDFINPEDIEIVD